MITLAQALAMKHGDTLLHMTEKDSKGNPVMCRVTGKVQTWKTRPNEFVIPVKYGLRTSFYIRNEDSAVPANAHVWCIRELWPVESILLNMGKS